MVTIISGKLFDGMGIKRTEENINLQFRDKPEMGNQPLHRDKSPLTLGISLRDDFAAD